MQTHEQRVRFCGSLLPSRDLEPIVHANPSGDRIDNSSCFSDGLEMTADQARF